MNILQNGRHSKGAGTRKVIEEKTCNKNVIMGLKWLIHKLEGQQGVYSHFDDDDDKPDSKHEASWVAVFINS